MKKYSVPYNTLNKIASRAWKRVYDTIGDASKQRLLDNDIHNYKRELEGLNTGSENILRKYFPDKKVISKIEDIEPAVNSVADMVASMKSASGIKMSLKDRKELIPSLTESILKSGPSETSIMGNSGFINPYKGYISKGNLSEKAFNESSLNIDKWYDYVKGTKSLEQNYADAISFRHEVDELRSAVHGLKNRLIIKNPENDTAMFYNPSHTSNFNRKSNHDSTDVLFREGVNVAIAPPKTKDAFLKMRIRNIEAAMIPQYGKGAVVDSKQMAKTNKTLRDRYYSKLDNTVSNYNTTVPNTKDKLYTMKSIPLPGKNN